MRALSLMLSRLCTAAWCGAGVLFTIILISLRASTLFTEATKLDQARVLFPIYYQMEFGLLSAAVLFAAASKSHAAMRGGRGYSYLGLVVAAWLIAIADYTCVYRPLAAMLDMPTLPDNFRQLHTLSRYTNSGVLLCTLTASLVGLWSADKPPSGVSPVGKATAESGV